MQPAAACNTSVTARGGRTRAVQRLAAHISGAALARAALVLYVVTQIVTQTSTLGTSLPQLPWASIDVACQGACAALALLAIASRRRALGLGQSVLLAATTFALACSAARAVDFRLVVGFVVIVSLADEDPREACRLHCHATLFAVAAVMVASLANVTANDDFIPNGRLVFGYGFRHPNTLGAILFSAAGSLTCYRWGKGAPVLPLLVSVTCTAFAYVALSSNAAAALCATLIAINLAGIVVPPLRRAKLPAWAARAALLVVPAALLAVMLSTTAHFDGANPQHAWLNEAVHSRPYYAHEYYVEAGGFSVMGSPAIVRNEHHAGGAFWGIDSGFSQLGLVYGLSATCMLVATYAVAAWRASGRRMGLAFVAIPLLCALYLVVEPFSLYLYSNFATLLLAAAFTGNANAQDTGDEASRN